MAGYVIAQIKVNDSEPFKDYVKRNTPVVEKYGGKFLVRGGEMEVLEGECPYPRAIVIQFPNVAAAREWYDSPEFRELTLIRKAAADTNLMLVEGV